MKVKKYIVNDIREAIKLIKKELGPEAVIINSRKVRRKGMFGFLFPRMLEVTAAIDELQEKAELGVAVGAEPLPSSAGAGTLAPVNPRVQAYRQSLEQAREAKKTAAGQPRPTPQVKNDCPSPAELQMRRELDEIKNLLQRMSKKESVIAKDEHVMSRWRGLLTELEIEQDIIDRLVSRIEKNPEYKYAGWNDRLKVTLVNEITHMLEPVYRDTNPSRVLSFIGPTGVGKTTTLAKLAARFTLFHQKSIAIITIDTYRIGAVEQLRTYADIIGVPLEVVMAPPDLMAAVNKHSDKDLILIDTAGRPSQNTEKIMELRSFLDVLPDNRDIFLVLSATTRRRDLYKIIEDYSKVEFNKLIVTKVDESDILGTFLNIAYKGRIPVVYVTDGQNVPDDIEQVYPKKLAKLLLKGVDGQDEGSGFKIT